MYFTIIIIIIIIKERPHERSSVDWPALALMNAQAVCRVVWPLWPCPVGSCWLGCVPASQQHVRSQFLPKFKLCCFATLHTFSRGGALGILEQDWCENGGTQHIVTSVFLPGASHRRRVIENTRRKCTLWRWAPLEQGRFHSVHGGARPMRGGQGHPAWLPPLRQALFFRKLRLSSCTVLSREASIEAPCKFLLRKYGSLCFKSLLAAQQPLMFNLVPCVDLSLWGCRLGGSTLPHPCTRPISHCKLISWCFWLLNQPLVGWEDHESVPWAWAVPSNRDTAAPRAPLNCDCRAGLSTPGDGMWPAPQPSPPTQLVLLCSHQEHWWLIAVCHLAN